MINPRPPTGEQSQSLTRRPRLWTPREMFRQAVQGFWYDASDMSTMFQDAAGTIPAEINKQVALIKDKSGNGNHLSQGVLSYCPFLYKDADGKNYLFFDGTDDYMATPAFAWGSDNMIMSLLANIPTTSGDFISFGSYSGNTGSWNFRISGNGYLHYISRGDGVTSAITSPASAPTYTGRKVVITEWGTISAPNVGGQFDSANAVNSYQTQGAGNYLSYPLEIGRRNPGGGFGRIAIYGVCASAARHRGYAKLETYMGKLK